MAAFEFVGLLSFQAFHQLEHTLEVVQKRLDGESVRPLLAGVDFEWAHFFGNTMLYLGLIAVVVAHQRRGWAERQARNRLVWAILVAGLVVQGSHVFEHIVRVVQYVGSGELPVGLATRWIDPVWFHFSINLVFLAALAVGFFGLNAHRDLRLPVGMSR